MSGLIRSKALHAASGFLLMGSWAAWANGAHAMPAPLIAALVQGTLTAAITLGLKRLVEAICARFAGPARYMLAPAGAGAVSATVLSTIHLVAGTPEIAATISVPLVVSMSYAAGYAYLQGTVPRNGSVSQGDTQEPT